MLVIRTMPGGNEASRRSPFSLANILTAEIPAPYPKYADAARRRAFYDGKLARVRSIPGLKKVGLTSDPPYAVARQCDELERRR
jgi:hypothetical protein